VMSSASTRWREHYFDCDICHIDEFDLSKDRLCSLGSVLRVASIRAYRDAAQPSARALCPLCEQPLLRNPVFWIDQHHDGVHDSCEEQRLADQELEAALRTEALGLG
jgi:hypothetical protein